MYHQLQKCSFVCGAQSAGKSVFTSFISSYLNQSRYSVLLIDLDCGQTFLSPPNILSLSKVNNILSSSPLGNVFLSSVDSPAISVLHTSFYGSNTPQSDPTYYQSCCRDLLTRALAYSEKCHIVVNTCGWTSGFGKELMVDVITDYISILRSSSFMSFVPLVLSKNPSEWSVWIESVLALVSLKVDQPIEYTYSLIPSVNSKELMDSKVVMDEKREIDLSAWKLKPQLLRDLTTLAWLLKDCVDVSDYIELFGDWLKEGVVKFGHKYKLLNFVEYFAKNVFEQQPYVVELSSFESIYFCPPLLVPQYLFKPEKVKNYIIVNWVPLSIATSFLFSMILQFPPPSLCFSMAIHHLQLS
ncbi:hypothetical protein GEMRC1_002545 [Eukaryota sp. GEM-RC1]